MSEDRTPLALDQEGRSASEPRKLSARRIALEILRELTGIHAAIIAGNSALEDILEELRKARNVDVEQRVDQGASDFDRELVDEQTRPTPRGDA